MSVLDVPIPARMAHLPKDRRGYPVQFVAVVDDGGKPHFQIIDEGKRQRVIAEDRCSICGTKLFRGRWFCGGPLSAFMTRGLYLDPPMHDECVHYALTVCPYLATPAYGKEIGDRTLRGRKASGIIGTYQDERSIPDRPDWFVAVMATGQDNFAASGSFAQIGMRPTDVRYLRPKSGTVRTVEIWRHGQRVTDPGDMIAWTRAQMAAADDAGRPDMRDWLKG